MNRLACVAAIMILPWCVTGCSKAPPGPALVKVKGTVTMDSQPMAGGQILFTVQGQPARSINIKDGTFEGEVHNGANLVEVMWNQDGPPNPMDPSSRIQVNVVSNKFWGPHSTLAVVVPSTGANDLKFEVTSNKR
jgi:hypothetical protein